MTNEQSLRDHLIDVLDWGNAHLRFDDAIKDFPVELRGMRPAGAPRSAWELLWTTVYVPFASEKARSAAPGGTD